MKTAEEILIEKEILYEYGDELRFNEDFLLRGYRRILNEAMEEYVGQFYSKEFVEWMLNSCRCESDGLCLYGYDENAETYKYAFTAAELFDYWQKNIKK